MKQTKQSLLDKGNKKIESGYFSEESQLRNLGHNEEVPYALLEDDIKFDHNIDDEKAFNKKSQIKAKNTGYQLKQDPLKSSQTQKSKIQYPQPTVYHVGNIKNSVLQLGPTGLTMQSRMPAIPPVVASCKKCQTKQHVPGNAEQFICCQCRDLQIISPLFGLFICGICRHYVCYQYNISDHIQCIYCHSVNKVTMRPVSNSKSKKVENILPKELRQEQNIQNEELAQVTTTYRQEDLEQI